MVNGYNLFGLNLNSKIDLKNYKSQKPYTNPHASLSFGQVEIPKKGLPDTHYTPFYIYNSSLYVHHIPQIAKYEIKNGNTVTIELAAAEKESVALFIFFDTILPILLMTNDFYPIHASAVYVDDGIHLFSCPRGEGKSTLAAALTLDSGFKFVSDDICVLRWDEKAKHFKTKCYHSKIQLWATSVFLLQNRNQKFKARPLRKGIKKFIIDFDGYELKAYKPVKSINVIKVKNEKIAPKFDTLTGVQKLVSSKNMIHSHKIAGIVAKDQMLFKYSGLIANNMIMNMVHRSRLTKVLDFSKFISDEILKKAAPRT